MWEQEAPSIWLLLIWTVILVPIIWTLTSIASNYAVARHIGFPIIISPVSTLNPLWIIVYRLFPPILQLKRLPFGFGVWARCTYMGWQFDDKHALHTSLGPIFTLVTPGGNELIVADPSAVHHILSRRKDFIKPAIMYDQLNVFGPNVNTVEGDDWQRQRKLTAPNFNEKISEHVWEETMRQAEEMVVGWVGAGQEGTREIMKDTATVALHVLTAVGFGVIYSFHGGVGEVNADKGHAMSYREALQICLANIITFSILPRNALEMAWMPHRLKRVGQAAREFQAYMEELLTVEKARNGGQGNLMSALVHAQAEDVEEERSKTGKTANLKLRDDEVFGNIFAFNLAGHETTANTVAAAVVLLAAHPEYQEWLSEEISLVLHISESSRTAGDYETCFPKLQRCLAVMYETLRLYGSIVFIPKTTGPHVQPLNMENKSHIVPPNTTIIINVQALHVNPGIWGSDVLSWRPDRWLLSQSRVASISPETTRFIDPQSGSYIPWADGPRVCLGRKFSKVEFVATMAQLFGRYRVRPAAERGMPEEEARRRCLEMVKDSAITAITLQMRDPRRMALVWEVREQYVDT